MTKPVDEMSLAEAIAALDEIEDIGDQIYSVREREAEAEFTRNPGFSGSTWELPIVERYNDLVQRIRRLYKQEIGNG